VRPHIEKTRWRLQTVAEFSGENSKVRGKSSGIKSGIKMLNHFLFKANPAAELHRHTLLSMDTAGYMSLQVPGSWLHAWVAEGCGPRSYFPEGCADAFTSLGDLTDWWGSDHFFRFVEYVESRTNAEATPEVWSDDRWFEAYHCLLRIKKKEGEML